MKYLETECQNTKPERALNTAYRRASLFEVDRWPLTALLLLVIALLFQLSAFAQATAFTYQGRLNDGAAVANGSYDLTFQLFDAPSGGASQGGPVTNSNVSLNSGLFTVTVDFGAAPFSSGAPRWLEIAVRTNGAGAFGALTPRQALTAAPYAILAGNISGVISTGSLSGTYSAALNFNNSSNQYTGSVAGNGAGLTNVNAARLGGLAASNLWSLSGNNVANGQFFGSTNNQALEFRANGSRALRLEPSGPYITIVGNVDNTAVSQTSAFIGGGDVNQIGGGKSVGTIFLPFPDQDNAITGGGGNFIVGSSFAFIGGGMLNIISNATSATIPGGRENSVIADFSLAAGRRAKAGHPGTFVWGDSADADFASTGTNQFLIRASGGVGIGKTNPATALDVNGTVTAAGFQGDGSGLSNVALLNSAQTFTADKFFSSGSQLFLDPGLASAPGLSFNGDSNLGIYRPMADTLAAATAGIERFRITAAGAVGIGTALPDAPLHVSEGSAGSVTANGNSIAVFERSASAYLSLLTPTNSESGILFGNPISTVDGGIFFNNSAVPRGMEFRTRGNSTKMTILGDGSVGIGTTFPSAPLTIRGVSVGVDWITLTDTNDVSQWQLNGFGGGLNFSRSFVEDGRLFLANGGNVGIGTITPSQKLHVMGNILASGTVNGGSDRNTKENFSPVDTREILDKVSRLPISRWNYKIEADVAHLGPMAQDFHAAFDVGIDDKHISMVDADGVALAAIQGLHRKVEEQAAQLKEDAATISELKSRMERLEQMFSRSSTSH